MIMQATARKPGIGELRNLDADPTANDERGRLRTPRGMA